MKSFIDEQVSQRGYRTSSEYVRELIRRDQDRMQLRGVLLAGATSSPAAPGDAAYFDGLRDRVRKSAQSELRSEGYFRREWNLAVHRMLDMAVGVQNPLIGRRLANSKRELVSDRRWHMAFPAGIYQDILVS